jgi:hypothetical protein
VAVDNPTGFDGSILKEIKDIKERLDQLSATPLGKVKYATAHGAPIAPVLTAATVTASVTVTVPPLATSCAYSVYAWAGGLNTTALNDYLTLQVEVTFAGYDNWTQQSQTTAPGTTVVVVVPMVDSFTFPPGGGTLTISAIANVGTGPWTNTTYNAVFSEGLLVFQY